MRMNAVEVLLINSGRQSYSNNERYYDEKLIEPDTPLVFFVSFLRVRCEPPDCTVKGSQRTQREDTKDTKNKFTKRL